MAALLAAALHTRVCGTVMRILSGLAGKMAPVAGPPAKAVPTPSAAFTAVHRRVNPVSQLRLGESHCGEVQQQPGASMAPHSGSAKSLAGRSNKSCPSSCPAARDSGGVDTAGSCEMEGGAGERQSACSRRSSSESRNVGSNEQQSAFSSDKSRQSRVFHLSRESVDQQQPTASRSRSSRVRQYRKRVCVRWGSLQWSLALVLVVRSAAAGCQGAACRHHHHHHHTATASHTLNVA